MKINKMKSEIGNEWALSTFEEIKNNVINSVIEPSDEEWEFSAFSAVIIDLRNGIIRCEPKSDTDQVKLNDTVLVRVLGRAISGPIHGIIKNIDNENVLIYPSVSIEQINNGDIVIVTKIQLAKGSDAFLPAGVQLTYAPNTQKPLSLEKELSGVDLLINNDQNDELGGGLSLIDNDLDGTVTTMEATEFVNEINDQIMDDLNTIDLSDIAEAIDRAGFAICEAELRPSINMYKSETILIPEVFVEAATALGLSGGPVNGADWALTGDEIYIDIPEIDTWSKALNGEPKINGIVYNHNGIEGKFGDTLQLEEIMVKLRNKFVEQSKFIEGIAVLNEIPIKTMVLKEMRRLKEKGDDGAEVLIGCRVKMFDSVTGDVWPVYEVIGIRGIRKREKICVGGKEKKGKCKRYYRLECKNGGDSTRSGKMRGRMYIECQYMKMVDLIDAFRERLRIE